MDKKINKGHVHGNTYYKHEKESQMMKMMGGAWSVNLAFITEEVKEFIFETDKAYYQIDRETAFKKGIERILQGEKKLVVPLRAWRVTLK